MQHVGNIFLYNNNQNNKNLYHHNLKEMGYFLFDTDNLHKFTLYNKEITPDVILFDFDNKTPSEFISSLEHRFERTDVPIIVVSETPKALIYDPAISHYLTHDDAKKHLNNILESYCIGNKHHHILYINLKPYEKSLFKKSAEEKGYTIFEVHNIKSASIYLKKNTPSVICINFRPVINSSQKLFSFPKTFYVENTQNVAEIEQFIN